MNKNERLICAFITAINLNGEYFENLKKVKLDYKNQKAVHSYMLKELSTQSTEMSAIFENLGDCLYLAYQSGCDTVEKENEVSTCDIPDRVANITEHGKCVNPCGCNIDTYENCKINLNTYDNLRNLVDSDT